MVLDLLTHQRQQQKAAAVAVEVWSTSTPGKNGAKQFSCVTPRQKKSVLLMRQEVMLSITQ